MTNLAAPAPGTRIFFLGDEAILFSEPRQELHSLNTVAAVIWCLLQEGLTQPAIAQDLVTRFTIPLPTAVSFVATALADWDAKGLLANTKGPTRRPASPGWAPRPGLPPYPGIAPPPADTRTYRLLTTRFAVRFATTAQFALLHPVLAHLEQPGASDISFDLIPAGDATILYCDKLPLEACASDQMLVPMAYACIWMTTLRRHEFFLNIHAGVLRSPAGCVLLPAPPGSGKSTLTAALVHTGFDYFSDEVALLSGNGLHVAPFPQAICLKESGIPAVAAFCPEAARLPLHLRADGKHVAYLPPPPERLPKSDATGTVRALIFSRYAAGAETRCTTLPKTTALARLLDQCTVLACDRTGGDHPVRESPAQIEQRLDAALVGRLITWIERLECRELVYGATADGVAAVQAALIPLRSR